MIVVIQIWTLYVHAKNEWIKHQPPERYHVQIHLGTDRFLHNQFCRLALPIPLLRWSLQNSFLRKDMHMWQSDNNIRLVIYFSCSKVIPILPHPSVLLSQDQCNHTHHSLVQGLAVLPLSPWSEQRRNPLVSSPFRHSHPFHQLWRMPPWSSLRLCWASGFERTKFSPVLPKYVNDKLYRNIWHITCVNYYFLFSFLQNRKHWRI